jgi:hypothetical protein
VITIQTKTTYIIVCNRCGSHTPPVESFPLAQGEARELKWRTNGMLHQCAECCLIMKSDPSIWKLVEIEERKR